MTRYGFQTFKKLPLGDGTIVPKSYFVNEADLSECEETDIVPDKRGKMLYEQFKDDKNLVKRVDKNKMAFTRSHFVFEIQKFFFQILEQNKMNKVQSQTEWMKI